MVRLGWGASPVHPHHEAGKIPQRPGRAAGAFSILDPTNPYRYLEVRGTIDQIDDDPTGSFIQELAHLYQAPWAGTSTGDEADRVILYLRPTKFVSHG
ncbi:Putative pyridoxamine 5'-phosphate oxidase [Mycobacteroides abscessus]|nr:Putative pyridoxamine 5'-phosphate oxidase [Mycobacteroides abscessus]